VVRRRNIEGTTMTDDITNLPTAIDTGHRQV
jgi:hypothetical protein